MDIKPTTYKWQFPNRFRACAFGWRASKLACQRIREAVSEIKSVARTNAVLGAEGAVRLMERLWQALEHVDSSSGALGSAVANALDVLIPIIAAAPAEDAVRNKWLDRMWKAIEEDGVDYLGPVADRWVRSVHLPIAPTVGPICCAPRSGRTGPIRSPALISRAPPPVSPA